MTISLQPSADTLAARQLFGGAISLALPERMDDISTVRPVPDHQEVFADGYEDQSIIVEILQWNPGAENNCAEFFWEDLCTANDALDASMDTSGPLDITGLSLPTSTLAYQLKGVFSASKGKQGLEKANTIQTVMAVFRFPDVSSVVLVTLSTPIIINEGSASAEHAGSGMQTRHVHAPLLFKQIIDSFAVNDWGLFGCDAEV